MSIVSTISDLDAGGTFLTWSMHYLAGHDRYFLAEKMSWVDIVSNPVLSKNAHGFKSNQIDKLSANELLTILKETDTKNFHSLYVFPGCLMGDIKKEIQEVVKLTKKIVLLSYAQQYPLWLCRYIPRSEYILSNGQLSQDSNEIFNDVVDHFFDDSKKTWEKLKLTAIWDKREFMALNFKPFKVNLITNSIDQTVPHFKMNGMDLWNTFNETVGELFQYLELPIDANRFGRWINVYNQWKEIHYNQLRFIWYFNDIIDSILNGYTLDLTRFNLDIQQEAAIQYILLYQHNLNLKTWQLEKFTCTKQLHNLLEPNIYHTLEEAV
jgi:hypothetical protein